LEVYFLRIGGSQTMRQRLEAINDSLRQQKQSGSGGILVFEKPLKTG
jgi:hypothetical protein